MKRTLGLLLVSFALGCADLPVPAAGSEHVLTGEAFPPYSGTVRIVMDGASMDDAFEEVAVVSAKGESANATLQAVLGALQNEAASLGCDAVIHVRYEQGARIASATGVAVRMK